MGLDTVELIITIEKYFDIYFKDDDIRNISEVGEIADLVADYLLITNNDQTEFNLVFSLLKSHWNSDVKLYELVNRYLLLDNISTFESTLDLQIPQHSSKRFAKLKKIFNYYLFEWNQLTIEQFINAIIIANKDQFFTQKISKTRYGIYIEISRIIHRHLGAPIYDIQPSSSITKDLRID